MTERAWLDREQPSNTGRTWLDRLAPGDEVIVQEHGRDSIASVYQRLPSGRILVTWDGCSREFDFDGRLRTSGTYTATLLVEPTPYRKDMIEKQHLARDLAEQQWHHMPLDKLRQIAKILRSS